MDFLNSVFSAEAISHTKPRIENGKYRIQNLGVDVFFQASNTDANFKQLGAVKALKAKHSALWDFSSGFFIISVPSVTKTSRSGGLFEHIALLDNRSASIIFQDLPGLAAKIKECGQRVVSKWNQENSSAQKQGRRAHVEFDYVLAEHRWNAIGLGAQKSDLKLILNTYNFTDAHQGARSVKIVLKDVDVQIKVHSTVFRNDNESSYDTWGFALDVVTFLSLLKHKPFAQVVRFASALAKEAIPVKQKKGSSLAVKQTPPKSALLTAQKAKKNMAQAAKFKVVDEDTVGLEGLTQSQSMDSDGQEKEDDQEANEGLNDEEIDDVDSPPASQEMVWDDDEDEDPEDEEGSGNEGSFLESDGEEEEVEEVEESEEDQEDQDSSEGDQDKYDKEEEVALATPNQQTKDSSKKKAGIPKRPKSLESSKEVADAKKTSTTKKEVGKGREAQKKKAPIASKKVGKSPKEIRKRSNEDVQKQTKTQERKKGSKKAKIVIAS